MNLEEYIKSLKLSSLARKIPNISEENAEFLKGLIRERKPRHILEIGTANGYSTLCFASALMELENLSRKAGGKLENSITTIEYAENAYTEAIKHFEATETTDIITPLFGDAKSRHIRK